MPLLSVELTATPVALLVVAAPLSAATASNGDATHEYVLSAQIWPR